MRQWARETPRGRAFERGLGVVVCGFTFALLAPLVSHSLVAVLAGGLFGAALGALLPVLGQVIIWMAIWLIP